MDELEALKPQVELLNRLGSLRLEDPFPQEEDGVVPSYLPTSPSSSTAPATSSSASYFAPFYATQTPGSSGPADSLEDWAKSIVRIRAAKHVLDLEAAGSISVLLCAMQGPSVLYQLLLVNV